MKAEIWFQDKLWGYIQDNGDNFVYSGPSKGAIREVIQSMERPAGQSAADFIGSLPQRLHGHMWAKLAGKEGHAQQLTKETSKKAPTQTTQKSTESRSLDERDGEREARPKA